MSLCVIDVVTMYTCERQKRLGKTYILFEHRNTRELKQKNMLWVSAILYQGKVAVNNEHR